MLVLKDVLILRTLCVMQFFDLKGPRGLPFGFVQSAKHKMHSFLIWLIWSMPVRLNFSLNFENEQKSENKLNLDLSVAGQNFQKRVPSWS